MTRGIVIAATLVGLLAAAVAGAHPTSSGRSPARLMVAGDEYNLVLSRRAVKRGPALIQFVNQGEDPHDLRLKRIGVSAARVVSAPEVRPGGIVELDTVLRSGRYRLWCSIPGHRQRGMRAVLSVRRPR
jgi:hypothetical protein